MTDTLRRAAGTTAALCLGAWAFAEGAAWAQGGAPADWQKIVAAAEKEGAVEMLIPPALTQRDFLQKEWPKDYPNIAIKLTTMEGYAWFRRVQTERSGGKFLWDMALTGAVVGYRMKDAGLLDPVAAEFALPDVKDEATWGGWANAFFDVDKKYVFTSQSFLKMPFYNAKLIAPEKVKSLGRKVFLDPALKGKIIWHDPLLSGSGQTFALVMRRLLGDEGLKAFVTEQVVFTSSMNDAVDRMARGQFAIGLGPVMSGILHRYTQAGVQLDIRPTGNTPEVAAYGNTGGSSIVVLKDRPHPNATRVFVNWLLSKPVATRLAKVMGQDTRRTDVPPQVAPDEARLKGVDYIEPQREDTEDELRASHAFIRKLRG